MKQAVLSLALSALAALATNAHAAADIVQPASTYAEVEGGDEGFAQSVTDGSLLSYQSGGYLATAQAAFGVNRVYASAQGAAAWIGAASLWTDKFTVDAPVGQAVWVSFSVLLSGANSAPLPIGGSSEVGGGEYDLLIHGSYQTPEDLLKGIDVPDNQAFIKVNLDHLPAFHEVHTNAFLAHGGDSFYVSSILGVGADRDQVMDFAHSAHFGISVGAGASLVSSSGTVYAAAVPEVGGAWLAVAGLMVLGGASGAVRRRQG